MAVVLVTAGRECSDCDAISFASDVYGHHHDGCRADLRELGVEMFVLPIAVLSSVDPKTDQIDTVKFTIRFDWKGRTLWREFCMSPSGRPLWQL